MNPINEIFIVTHNDVLNLSHFDVKILLQEICLSMCYCTDPAAASGPRDRAAEAAQVPVPGLPSALRRHRLQSSQVGA